jgi:hypothetical protein
MLLNNTPAVAKKHYIHLNDSADAVKKLRALVAMAPALLLPAVDTQLDSEKDRRLEVTGL